MAEQYENYKKLTPKQRVMVKLYTDESGPSYLKKAESFRRAGFCSNGKATTQHSAASRMFNSPTIIAAIKELAPKSFDAFFVCNEMLDNYKAAKAEGKLDLCHKMLVDMGKVEGLFADKKKSEDSVSGKEIAEVQRTAQELWRKRSEEMAVMPTKKAK
jgi:hypothetical protein